MSRQLTYTLIADGGTDKMLLPIIDWAIRKLDPEVQILQPDFVKRMGNVPEFLAEFRSGAMLVFVHRDSERETLQERLREFESITRPSTVPIVPVQMSEAWVLFDGQAIAGAAGSRSPVESVPKVRDIESIRDPKRLLEKLIYEAAGSPTTRRGRSLKRSMPERRVRVASLIPDFGPLERLEAFRAFQDALASNYPYRDVLGL